MYLVKTSMTDIADKNNKWASYAGPGGWNGNYVNYDYKLTTIFHVSKTFKSGLHILFLNLCFSQTQICCR